MSDVSSVFFPRRLVKEFISKYKECECLWNKNCTEYKAKLERQQAISELTELVQKYDPAATRVHILRKIDSLRACVRREYKKVLEHRLNATSDKDSYTTQLWYYNDLSFVIQDEEQQYEKIKAEAAKRAETMPMPVSPDLETEYLEEESEEEERESSPEPEDVKPEPTYVANCPEYIPRKSSPKEPRRKRPRRRGSEGLSRIDDEYDAIGVNVAAKLRYLPDNMRILAEKLISDVLFQAQTNGLTAASALVTPDPFH